MMLAVVAIGDRPTVISAERRRAVIQYSNRALPAVVTNMTNAVYDDDDDIADASMPSNLSEGQVFADTLQARLSAPLWTQYFWFFIVLVLAVVSESLLIAGFIGQRAKRRRAEATLRLRETALRRSSERIGQLAGQLINA